MTAINHEGGDSVDVPKNKSAFELDEPITCKEQDLLGMAGSAAALARHCLFHDGVDSFAVGVYGEWGSGKTSFVGLLRENIIAATENLPEGERPILFSFDPWACDPSDPMLRRFLSELAASLSEGSAKMKKARNVAAKLRKYADAAAPMVPIPGVMGVAGAALESFAESGTTVASLKHDVSKMFQKLGKRVFVFIDDLDRLPDEQIRAVFQLVNHTASFSNIVYILAFDYDVVAAALDGTQHGSGANYIRKIIQVAYSVPRFSRTAVMGYFLKRVEPYFEVILERDFDRGHYYQTKNAILGPSLRSLREAKRIINTFVVNCETVSEELDLTDVLAMSAIEVADPSLYAWIHANKELVCLPEYGSTLQKDYSSQYDEKVGASLLNLRNGNRAAVDDALEKLKSLFPKVSRHGQSFDARTSRTYRRISSPAYFDLYFSSDAESVTVPRADLESLINLETEDVARLILEQSAKSNRLTDLLEEMRCHEGHFSASALEKLIKPLFRMLGKSSENPRSILELDADTRIRFILNDILRKLGVRKADLLVGSLMGDYEGVDGENFVALSAWINDFELAYGRLAAKGDNPNDQVISLDTLEKIECIFVENAPKYAYGGELLRYRGSSRFLCLWHALDEKGFGAFWEAAFPRSELFYAYLVLACSGEWSSGVARGWTCSAEPFGGLASRSQIVPHLLNLKGTDALEGFTDEELCKLITYVEGSSDSDIDRYYTENDAMQHIAEWRTEAPPA